MSKTFSHAVTLLLIICLQADSGLALLAKHSAPERPNSLQPQFGDQALISALTHFTIALSAHARINAIRAIVQKNIPRSARKRISIAAMIAIAVDNMGRAFAVHLYQPDQYEAWTPWFGRLFIGHSSHEFFEDPISTIWHTAAILAIVILYYSLSHSGKRRLNEMVSTWFSRVLKSTMGQTGLGLTIGAFVSNTTIALVLNRYINWMGIYTDKINMLMFNLSDVAGAAGYVMIFLAPLRWTDHSDKSSTRGAA